MTLFTPVSIGAINLPNRVVMAPMTRSRSTQPGDVPNAMIAEYYAQRASAGMIITEATQITPEGKGYSFTPGIHSEAQIARWKQVTDAVHAKGGRIVLQLWHVGRMSHPMFHADGKPVAPSAIAPDATVWIVDPETGEGGMVECPVPRTLESDEIARVLEDYRLAARNAKAAGFDGVEIHAANRYLIDEFLRSTSNHRADAYGGSVENRIRFAIEVAEAVASEMGADRTGIRFSPFITQRGMNDPDAPQTILKLAKELDRIGLTYIHLAEADWDDAPETPEWFRKELRKAYSGSVIVAGGYTPDKADAIIDKGYVDAVAFGRPFIANPDLPRRFAEDLPLSDFDGDALFGGDAAGYTTYGVAA
ncbi:NADH:flavin oxidoreductase, Old Yellow Enzyme family [Phaeobacter inhibens]|uniref:NADH:flavin oxidoreductase, Old Yellow Enzyme family n=1 Tax=Phaeobacter inhibens TaxID=221822 RepID=A0A2I7GCS1_9RHOB|nr:MULTISPECIES: alkene reductase [Phaeobacter]AUQ51392.1 NADH:flavin oxidoreductase, Old Yellow Enzyme family [Phaeobacter inhibens]AUQ95911.1 NADH:flavin oxidoreductase, Old Yellow Enzyme family [Phaeobacter inhibens]AUQ97594.1 NADH:flavin oxidoreductase, Old Yellow Enzyme family [Phaeobacter inhibens]AUR21197.1 NADH:flavin oxidoreductase, Old Yellow Enzyme family [Phaeobacter inhibens]MBQ4808881.1 alkene reductase [Phaeobacter sp. HS012]